MPNHRLVAPQFRVWSENEILDSLSVADTSCHYLHTGQGTVAALSACRDHALVSCTFQMKKKTLRHSNILEK